MLVVVVDISIGTVLVCSQNGLVDTSVWEETGEIGRCYNDGFADD